MDRLIYDHHSIRANLPDPRNLRSIVMVGEQLTLK